MKNTNLLKSVSFLFFVICSTLQGWGENQTITSSAFYKFYSTSNDSYSTIISNASLGNNVSTTIANAMNGKLTAVPSISTPHNFAGLNTDTKYYRLKMGSSKTITITGLANLKSVTLYGNGHSSSRTITVTVTKVSGSGSAFTVTNLSLPEGSATISSFQTDDFSAKSGYDASTYYTYTFTANGDVSIWGIYLEAGPTCTAPNHVDISGAWDRFGGETISLTATAYSSAGTGSPISDANISGWQWQKWNGSSWVNVTNGTVDGVVTSGATSKNLQISNCGGGNSGTYRCTVSTGATCSTSSDGYGVKVYVLECYTGGTTTYNFTREGNNQAGSLTIDLEANTAYQFKFHADNDYYGNNTAINEDVTNWVCSTSQDNNITINSGLGGTFTIDMEYSAAGNSSVEGEPEISVTYPRKRIYLSPGVWDADDAKFAYNYYRDGGSGGWTDFLTEDDCGMYADVPQWNGVILIPARLKNTTVSPGSWDDRWNQTDNITVNSNNYVTITGWDASDFTYTIYSAPTYTISYAKGSPSASISGSKSDETKTCGVDFTLPSSAVFTREGYLQTGWATSDGGSKAYDLGGTYTTNSTQTFYPAWTINSHTLTWNLNGGTVTVAGTGAAVNATGSPSTSVEYGTAITAPTVTKTGYTFTGWNTTPAATMPDANATYSAQWTANSYSVSHSLSNVTKESGATGSNAATYGTNYTATFSRILGYSLPSTISVTAGGSNITANCTWNSSTGSLTIPGAHIVGNIVITVSGTAIECPDNGVSPTTLYSAVIAATSAQSIPAEASNQRLTSSQATVSGGFMSVYNGQTEAKNLIAKQNNEWWFCETNANTYFRIDLDCALQKGDIITANCYASGEGRGIWVSSETSRPSSAPACAGTTESEGEVINYKVTTSDEYYGKQTLYIYRATSNSTYFNNVKVTRPAACTDAAAVTSFTCSSQTQTSLTYTWTKATGATAYTAKLWDNSSCTGETVDTKDLGNVATVTFSGLDAGNTYYCKVTSLGDGDTYCEEGETTSAVSGTTSACTAISPTFSYPFMTVAKGITIIPDIDAKGSSGTVSYASSATGVITNDRYVTATSGTATLTATVAAKGAYCEGVVTSGTFTAVADQTGLIRQALTTGDNTWGTPAAPTKSDATNITSTTAIAATGITIDGGKGNTNNDGQTAKVGSLSSYDASKYMSLGFTVRTGKKVNVNAIYIPVQPVTSDANTFKAVLSDASTSITGTISDVPNGKLTYIKFDSYGTVRGNVTLKLYAYGWTNGYRLGKGIVIDGTVVSETYTVTLDNQGATTAGAASINVDFETVTGNISSNLPAKPGYNFGGYYTEVDGEGVQFIAPDGTFNSSITDYTDAGKRWIATSGITLYAKWTPAALTFTGASNSNWSNTANWTPACVPTIDHDVTIQAPAIVDIPNARAKSVVINNDGDTKTGQLEINAGMELVVATTLKKTTDGSNRIATTVNDIVINSTSVAGLGALVMGSHDGTNKATVNFTTRAAGVKDDNTSIAQYVGTPFNDENNILYNWYNSWIYGIAYEGGSIDWVRINEGEGMIPFRGYCVFSADGANHVYWEQGTLNATTDRTISGLNWQSGAGTANLNNENLLANSWMAPIYIKAMESSDFVNADATIYIFNSTSAKAYESGSFAGNYDSYTVNTAEAVIPAMQSFSVFTTGTGASVTLDYSRIVYDPAVAGTAAPEPNKVISRERKTDNEANKLRIFVRTESGLGDMLYMWEREDFSEAFENGWDGRKMYGESYAPQLYAITPDGAMAVNCVPTYEGVLIGFRAGTDEQTYTFSFEYDADAEPLYLYDKYADVYTRVLSGNTYQFVANDYEAHARFNLTHYMPGVATGIEASATGDQNPEIRCQKILLNERILILRDGKLYDVTGKTVK